jgi:hypothetical protein
VRWCSCREEVPRHALDPLPPGGCLRLCYSSGQVGAYIRHRRAPFGPSHHQWKERSGGREGGRSRSDTGWEGRESKLTTTVSDSVVTIYVATLNKLMLGNRIRPVIRMHYKHLNQTVPWINFVLFAS